jgi:hypothetical protein
MNALARVRTVHVDYAGADGFPKPMLLALASEATFTRREYEHRAENLFRDAFPRWRLRSCVAAERDVECPRDRLMDVGLRDVWLMKEAAIDSMLKS